MLDLAMDIPMLLDTTTLARGLLMPSPRLRLILLFLWCLLWRSGLCRLWICWTWLWISLC